MQPEPGSAPSSSSAIALADDCRGGTAIELALLGVPFFFLIMAIFELALLVLVSGNLDTATSNAARQSGMLAAATPAGVAAAICDTMPSFGRDCGAALAVTLDPLPAQPGQSTIVRVRAIYQWPLLSPLLANVLPDGGGNIALIATSAFRPEAG